jgi:ComF family protein
MPLGASLAGWQALGAASISTPGAPCQPQMASAVDSRWDRLLGLLFPPQCVLCGRAGQHPCHDLCIACEAELPVAFSSLCMEPAAHGVAGCDRLFAVCSYAPPVDTLIHALKYGGELAIGRVLGTLLARGVAELGLHLDVDCVVPVPLHPLRHAERGFNQSAEIACFAARRLGLPLEPRLAVRCRDTRSQVGLPPADRRINLRDAFAADSARLRRRRIVIVDDVMTTGSTVAELSRTLRRAGVASVDAWCVARATTDVPVRGSEKQEG